jgi:hypothetical protein
MRHAPHHGQACNNKRRVASCCICALATAATDWAAACERQELNNRKRASANTAAYCNAGGALAERKIL